MRSLICLLVVVVLVLVWPALFGTAVWGQAAASGAPANFKYAAVARDAAVLAGLGPERSAGSEGARQSADYLADALAERTGQAVFRQRFTITVPVVDFCRATAPGNPPRLFSLWPLAPAGAQPAALPGGEGTADITYAGRGTLDELNGKPIRDRWVALSVESGQAWQTIASLGARGIIFLGGRDTVARDLLDKQTTVPIGLPRFYSDDAALRAALESGAISRLTVRVHVHWEERPCANVLCIIPGRAVGSLPAGAAPDWTDQTVILQASYDATSMVMGRSPGALPALNAAAVLDLAGRISRLPSHATVVVLFTGGDEWLFHGTRAFLDLLDESDSYSTALQKIDRRIGSLTQALGDGREMLGRLGRVQAGDLTELGKKASWSARDPLVETLRDELDRRSGALEEELRVARLEAGAAPPTGAQAARLADLNRDKQARLDAASALDRLRDLEAARPALRGAAEELLPVWRREVDRRAAALDMQQDWPAIRQRIGARPIMIDLGLALSDGSAEFGLFARSQAVALNDLAGRMAPFNKSFDRYLADAQEADANYVSAYDPRTVQSAYPLEGFLAAPHAFATDIALLQGVPASSFATLGDADARLDTPNDVLDRIRWTNVERQLTDVFRLLLGSSATPPANPRAGQTVSAVGALTDPFLFSRTDFADVSAAQTIQLYERTLGQGTPHVPAIEHLVGVEQVVRGDGSPMPALLGVRALDWAFTPMSGAVTFTGLASIEHRLQAFHLDADGLIDRAASQAAAPRFNPDRDNAQTVLMFDCRRADLFELFDPRYLEYLDHLELLDALRRDRLPDVNTYFRAGLAAVFLPSGTRWQLLVSKGAIGNRMVLINADAQHPTGQGFASPDRDGAALPPLAWQNARDLFALDAQRKHDLESFGISNDVIKTLHGGPPLSSTAATQPVSAYDHLQAGQTAEQNLDYAAWLAHANAAESLEITVYNNLIATSNGIIRGVIFLLAGLIPFSYFLERLIIGSTRVLRQIGAFAAIFAIMTAALWFHPAFRISAAPAMILLAFLILLLSSAVVWILWGKFEQEVTRLRGATAAVHISSFQRGAVIGSAIRLGLSNMRRRGTRTGLTLTTLILLTFTLLCFTSVREAVTLTPRRLLEAPAVAPPGILIHQAAWQPLPPPINTLVREITGPHGIASYRYTYASDTPDLPWQIPVQSADGRQDFIAAGLVGLDPHESTFQSANMEQSLPGWSALAGGDRVCCLPADARASTSFQVGDTVRILGQSLRIAGFFTADGVSHLQQLTGGSLMPIDPASSGGLTVPSAGATAQSAAPLIEQSFRSLSPRQIVIIPAAVARELGARLTSVMLLPQDVSRVTPLAQDLARRSAFTVVASDGQQIRAYNAAAASSTENLDRVVIPMILAGIIVLSTMLGAVAERKREIHVYTSLGLAPIHIGTLFLAEAAALGTLGVVFGYIFGQGLATILSHFHIISGVELNYSSVPAMATMGLVLAIVMLSSLWPARLAARVATPSLQRDWKLPAAKGDVLLVELPFTVNQSAAQGVCAFLAEFFISVSQAGTGHFTAENVRPFLHGPSLSASSIPTPPIRGIKAHVWLAPYDLGVLQTLWLAIHPTPDEHVYEVHLTLVREAGNPATWQRLNRPFLVEIRKQFLLWRAVAPNLVQQYIEQSVAMFADAEMEGPPGEEANLEVQGVEVLE